MSIIAPSKVRERMFLQDLPEVEDNLAPLIEGSKAQIESAWGTSFTLGTTTEYFNLSGPKKGKKIRLVLGNGLVRGTPTVAIAASDGFPADSDYIETTEFKLDRIQGWIYLLDSSYGDWLFKVTNPSVTPSVRVTYSFGFDYSEQSTEVLPPWLEEALVLQTIINTVTHPTQYTSDKAVNLLPTVRGLTSEILNAHNRRINGAYPCFSE